MEPARSSQNPGVAPDPFLTLYQRTFPRVWSALGRLGIPAGATREDFAQDVYLVASQKLATRDPNAPELAWLFTIARNLVQNHRQLNRTRHEQPMSEPDTAADLLRDTTTAEDVVAGRREYLALVEGMAPERREVFELHEIEGFTVPEIAKTLGEKEGTVATRLRLAREEVEATRKRMQARDAHRARSSFAMVLPFGAGAWGSVRDVFGEAPPGAGDSVWQRVQRGLVREAVLAGMKGGTAGVAAAVVAAGTGAMAGAGTAGAVAGGLVVAAAMLLLRPAAPEPTVAPPVVAEARSAVATETEGARTTAATQPEASVPGAVSAAAAVTAAPRPFGPTAPAPSPAAASQLDPDEAALISRAQVAFARKDRAGALEALDAHARRFPRGKLVPERELIRGKLNEAASSWAAPPPATTGRPRFQTED